MDFRVCVASPLVTCLLPRDTHSTSTLHQELESTHLHISARVPVRVKQYHPVSSGEVHPHAPSSSSQKHDEYGVVCIEAIDEGLRDDTIRGQRNASFVWVNW